MLSLIALVSAVYIVFPLITFVIAVGSWFVYSRMMPPQSALNVSEYTDNVDTMSRRSKSQRILAGLRDMASIASGLYVCTDLKKVGMLTLLPTTFLASEVLASFNYLPS